jgi:hypothetical protein
LAVQARMPGFHGHQLDALATASWAMAQARSCRALADGGWHFLLRVQGQKLAWLDDDAQVSLSELARRRGDSWCVTPATPIGCC